MAAALLFGPLAESEWQFLDQSLGTKACWDALIAHHHNEGPIRQGTYLQDALTTKFS